jgi:hypothetical protein
LLAAYCAHAALPPQNEPDLGGLGCINATTWLEHLTLRSQAVQNAYVHAARGARRTLPC